MQHTYHTPCRLAGALTAALLLALAGGPMAAPAAAEGKGLTNPFFAFDNGLRGITDAPKVLKELGYAGIMARGPATVDLAKTYDAQGMKVFSSYATLWVDRTPGIDPKLAELVKALKGTGVILWPNVQGGKAGQDDDKAVAVLREFADLAKASDLRVCLYPHAGMYVGCAADAIRLVKKAERDNLGVAINLCHELATKHGGELEATIQAAKPYLFLVSINGSEGGAAVLPLGQGKFDVYAFLKALKESGYDGPVGLQCYQAKGDPVENLRASIAAWRAYSDRLAKEEKQ